MKTYAIIGAGGFGREVISVARDALLKEGLGPFELIFVDDAPPAALVNGYPVITTIEFLERPGEKYFNIAIADAAIRQRMADALQTAGARAFSIIAGNCHVGDNNNIGEGAIFCPMTTTTANATIGKFFHANIYSYVAHDCIIGDYVTFAPNVQCNGGVIVEDYVYVGTGAIIKQGTAKRPIVIGKGAIIGMGSVVTKSVPAHSTVFGNPAKPFGRGSVSTKTREG